jgi:hypothetical protein
MKTFPEPDFNDEEACIEWLNDTMQEALIELIIEKGRKMNNYDLAQANRQRQKELGNIYIDGTIKDCPWPGCKESAVSGWGSCGSHFDVLHNPPPSPTQEQLYRELAVALVDCGYGYTIEFSGHPRTQRKEYDRMEENISAVMKMLRLSITKG